MPEPGTTGRVLVVDDTASNRYVLVRVLRAEGLDVVEGTSGAEALTLAVALRPDVIVLDVKLPDMLGFEVAERLRAARDTQHIAILNVSASYTSDDAHALGLRRGADAYLVHPVAPQVLAATVNALLRMRRAEQQAADLLVREQQARAEAEGARALAEERERERNRLNHELEQAVRARDDLISMASHDLRGPLMTLQLRVHSLLRQIGRDPHALSPEFVVPKLERCQHQIGGLAGLLDELLDVSVIRAGHLQLLLDDVDLSDVARSAVERAREQLSDAGIEIRLTTSGPVTGTWDRVRLSQVLDNLLSNAIKYGGGQPIDVEVEASAGTARLVVRDHGEGISEADQARIFEAFERARTDEDRRSFGLGLWIVNRVVHALGGDIAVTSEVGKGSTFTIELPRRGPPHDAASAAGVGEERVVHRG